MDAIQDRNKELVRVLLLVARQMGLRQPHFVQKRAGAKRQFRAVKHVRKEPVHFAGETVLLVAQIARMLVAQEKGADERIVHKGLQDYIDKTRGAEVLQAPQCLAGCRLRQFLDFVEFLRRWDPFARSRSFQRRF